MKRFCACLLSAALLLSLSACGGEGEASSSDSSVDTSQEEVREALREILMAEMEVGNTALKLDTKPSVCIFIGVNGVGLPGRRRRPAGDLGGAGRMRDRPAVRGRGPRRRTVRRTSGC